MISVLTSYILSWYTLHGRITKEIETMKTYTTQDVINAECNLEPLQCRFCGSVEVVFLQYVGDASCQECGKWQIEDSA